MNSTTTAHGDQRRSVSPQCRSRFIHPSFAAYWEQNINFKTYASIRQLSLWATGWPSGGWVSSTDRIPEQELCLYPFCPTSPKVQTVVSAYYYIDEQIKFCKTFASHNQVRPTINIKNCEISATHLSVFISPYDCLSSGFVIKPPVISQPTPSPRQLLKTCLLSKGTDSS